MPYLHKYNSNLHIGCIVKYGYFKAIFPRELEHYDRDAITKSVDYGKILFVLAYTPIFSISRNLSGPEPRQSLQASPVTLDTQLTNFSSTPLLNLQSEVL